MKIHKFFPGGFVSTLVRKELLCNNPGTGLHFPRCLGPGQWEERTQFSLETADLSLHCQGCDPQAYWEMWANTTWKEKVGLARGPAWDLGSEMGRLTWLLRQEITEGTCVFHMSWRLWDIKSWWVSLFSGMGDEMVPCPSLGKAGLRHWSTQNKIKCQYLE